MIDALLIELERIARAAGGVLMSHFDRLEETQIDFKGRRDLVTVADRESEELILAEIAQTFPDHAVLAEESGEHGSTGEGPVWIVDPLDGTTNFVHRIPMFAVSIGVFEAGRPLAGCVYAPRLDELFLAGSGRGTRLNGELVRVSATSDLMDALLTTGFAYRVGELERDNLDNFCHLIPRTRAVRRCGSAAVDLAYTACGRYDGFWELHLSPWDVAAGAICVLESGGVVTDFDGGEDWLHGGSIVAGNGGLQAAILRELDTVARVRGEMEDGD